MLLFKKITCELLVSQQEFMSAHQLFGAVTPCQHATAKHSILSSKERRQG